MWRLNAVSWDQKFEIMRQVLHVGQYSHDHLGVFHLDLHSENVLVCSEHGRFVPKFFDWDFALCPSLRRQNPNHYYRWKKRALGVEEAILSDRSYRLNLALECIHYYRMYVLNRFDEDVNVVKSMIKRLFIGRGVTVDFINALCVARSTYLGSNFPKYVIKEKFFKDVFDTVGADFDLTVNPMAVDNINFEEIVAGNGW